MDTSRKRDHLGATLRFARRRALRKRKGSAEGGEREEASRHGELHVDWYAESLVYCSKSGDMTRVDAVVS